TVHKRSGRRRRTIEALANGYGEAFSLARIIEARFEAIAEKEKEHINKKKGDTSLPLQHKLASPEIKGSLDADKEIRVDEVSIAIDCVIHIGESNEVRSKKSRGAAEEWRCVMSRSFLDNTLRTRWFLKG
ncbi:hypothetical protein Tco_1560329, partial [Tanacetum coccineum]